MNTRALWSLTILLSSLTLPASAAPFMRPPAFLGGIPGKAQFQSILTQRHQARTLLYREALEELRKNPHAADVPDCPSEGPRPGVLCLTKPKPSALPDAPNAVALPTAPHSPIIPSKPEPAPAPAVASIPPPPHQETAPIPPRQEPATPPATKPSAISEKPVLARRKLAILFGLNSYAEPIPQLDTPIADVEGIAEVLKKRYGYDTRIVKDAKKAQIVEALNTIASEAAPDDSVLLFYAGHGYLMDDTKMGYWIPSDASVKTAANWISNNDISKLLTAIPARQLILISDSCFSGSLTKEQKITGGKADPEKVLKKRSVLAFSSGGEEPVSDAGKEGHSIFAWNLINTLQTINNLSGGYEVYSVVHNSVMKDFPQEPQYGAVVSAGHTTGGEYLFDSPAH